MAVLNNTMLQGTAADSGDEDYQIEHSLRFASNQQLKSYNPNRTTGWPGNTRTFTYATWLKRTKQDEDHYLLNNYADGNNAGHIRISSSNDLNIGNKVGGTWQSTNDHSSKGEFRDPTAWMHLVFVWDATHTDPKERHRMYVNGVRERDDAGYLTQLSDAEGYLNNNQEHRFGGNYNNSGFCDGNMADVYFIDGLALHPGCFGKFNDEGIWIPIKFELPQPNKNTTWSGMVSGTVMSGRAKTRMFDGSTMNQTNGDETTLTFTPTGGIKANSEITVRMIIDGTPVFKVNGISRLYEVKDLLGNNTTGWYTLPTRDLTSLEWSETGGNECAIYGIKVDGITLQDGRTDVSYATRLEKAGPWHKMGSGTVANGCALSQALQGQMCDGTVNWMADTNSVAYFKPWGDITSSSTIRMFVGQGGAWTDGTVYLSHEGVNLNSNVISAVGTDNWGWVDLPTVGGENKITAATGIAIARHASNGNACRVKAIEVDGQLLYIGNQTSCYFDFNKLTNVGYNNFSDDMDTYRDGVARTADTNRIGAKKTGAAPFWNTSSLGFGTGGDTARPDSFAGTTDGAGLILACPGNWLGNTDPSGTDQHALLNTGSGQKTSGHTGMTTGSGGPSGYNLGYFSHDVDEITFGTTDVGDFDFGTGDFCIEGWWQIHTPSPSGTAGWVGLVHGRNSSGWGINVGTHTHGNKVRVYGGASGSLILESEDNIIDGNWFHIAVTRSGSTCRLFVNGWIVKTATNNENWNADDDVHIGAGWPSGMTEMTGSYQDLRIYKGVAKYTENFDLPRRYHHNAQNFTLDMTGSPPNYHSWDISVDSPTDYEPATGSDGTGGVTRGNYPTLNYKWMKNSNMTVHEAGGRVNGDGSNHACVAATMHIPRSGKWYFEMRRGTGSNHPMIGIKSSALSEATIANSNVGNPSFFVRGNEARYMDGTEYAGGLMAGFTQASYEMIGVAIDMDNGAFYARKPNGDWINSGDPTSGASKTGTLFTTVISDLGDEHYWIPCMKVYDGSSHVINFGQVPFQLGSGAPAGYKCLCSTNFPDESITKPTDHFDVTLYTGSGGANQPIKGFDFQPDLWWAKMRDGVNSHHIVDAIRSGNNVLLADTYSEDDSDPNFGLTFQSDGVLQDYVGSYTANTTGSKYFAYAWDCGAAAVTPSTQGSITPSAQWVSNTAGFSMTKYEGTEAAATVGHGLSAAPEFLIVKNLDVSASNWLVWHKALAATEQLYLHTNDAKVTGQTNTWNSTAPTNTVFSLNASWWSNDSGENHIAYCWTGIPGFSKFGSYTGTGGNSSTVDQFIWTGFKPALLMIKCATAGVTQWMLVDHKRWPNNPNKTMSWADDSAAEEVHVNNEVDLFNNGFALVSNTYQNYSNTNGETFIYAAWAQNPFKKMRAH